MTRLLAIPAAVLLVLPLLGLLTGVGPGDLLAALGRPGTVAALWLSIRTSVLSVGVCVLLGTPLAWSLSRATGTAARLLLVAVELPVVLPPAVLGLALLRTFGRNGLLGAALAAVGVTLPLTTAAVVVAQVVVAVPLYVLIATAAFRAVDDDALLVARTLGAGPGRAFATVALPAAAPGLLSAAGLAWARALGEFGATLMFAGNLSGRTQTLPLAIYDVFGRDLAAASAMSWVLVLTAAALLLALRGARG